VIQTAEIERRARAVPKPRLMGIRGSFHDLPNAGNSNPDTEVDGNVNFGTLLYFAKG
jgi:hypothetical protein